MKAVAKKPQPNEKVRLTFPQQLTAETIDKIRIRSELLNLLLAGRDTAAALLTNVWFQLARHHKIEARLRNEINDTTGNHFTTLEDLTGMKYLYARFDYIPSYQRNHARPSKIRSFPLERWTTKLLRS